MRAVCYYVRMKSAPLILILLTFALPALAFNPTVTEVAKPYDIVPVVSSSPGQALYLGELLGYPVMYEIVATESFVLQVQMQQPANTTLQPLALIAVKSNEYNGGVSEVARLRPELTDWTREKDSALGLSFWVSPVLEAEVEPGTYRVEISSANNKGKFLLRFGDTVSTQGYFATLGDIQKTQKFFGYSSLKLLTSSYVYYPLGILLLLFVFYKTWHFRKFLSHDS